MKSNRMNMKNKKYIGVVAAAALTVVINVTLTLALCNSKTVEGNSSINDFFKKINGTGIRELYKKNGVTVSMLDYLYDVIHPVLTSEEISKRESTGISPVDSFIYLLIEDGNTRPIRIISPQADSIPIIQTVNDRYVVIVMGTSVGGFSDVFIADRKTREVNHYPHSNLAYLTTTSDAQKLIFMENNSIVVYDPQMKKLQTSGSLSSIRAFSLGYISPDDKLVAFHERIIGDSGEKERIFLYNIEKNTVQQVGQVDYAEEFVWKNNKSFVNVVMNVVDGKERKEDREIFTVKD